MLLAWPLRVAALKKVENIEVHSLSVRVTFVEWAIRCRALSHWKIDHAVKPSSADFSPQLPGQGAGS
jgi:hypothetical protein